MSDEDVNRAEDEEVKKAVENAEVIKPSKRISAFALAAQYADYEPCVIDGILRQGEIMNLISMSKRGKTWINMDLAICAAVGMPWLGNKTKKCRVGVVDNEFFGSALAQRLKAVAAARGVRLDEVSDSLGYYPLRGDLKNIEEIVDMVWGDENDLLIIDAFYRTYPIGTNENDNGIMASLYNHIDRFALKQKCAAVLIHHEGKGNQSQKKITDVGAGAGSFARATDTHMILRQHPDDDDGVIMEAVCRTFQQPAPKCLRYQYPVWVEASDLNADALKTKERERDAVKKPSPMSPQEFARKYVSDRPLPREAIVVAAALDEAVGSSRAAQRLLAAAESLGLAFIHKGNGRTKLYANFEDKKLIDN